MSESYTIARTYTTGWGRRQRASLQHCLAAQVVAGPTLAKTRHSPTPTSSPVVEPEPSTAIPRRRARRRRTTTTASTIRPGVPLQKDYVLPISRGGRRAARWHDSPRRAPGGDEGGQPTVVGRSGELRTRHVTETGTSHSGAGRGQLAHERVHHSPGPVAPLSGQLARRPLPPAAVVN